MTIFLSVTWSRKQPKWSGSLPITQGTTKPFVEWGEEYVETSYYLALKCCPRMTPFYKSKAQQTLSQICEGDKTFPFEWNDEIQHNWSQVYSKNEVKVSALPWFHPTLAMGCKFTIPVLTSSTWTILLLYLMQTFFQYWMKNRDKKMPVVEPIREEDWMWFRFVQTLVVFLTLHTFSHHSGGIWWSFWRDLTRES